MAIIPGLGPGNLQLALQTATGWDIPNAQFAEIPPAEQGEFAGLAAKYQTIAQRSGPSPRYNCHGLTFAERRTRIFDSMTIARILQNDGYVEIAENDVLPGDVVVYFGTDGDFEHSAIVVSPPAKEPLRIPIVISKWGSYSEFVHLANNTPYSFGNAKYYRITL